MRKEEFINRFVVRLKEKHEKFFITTAEASWEQYEEDPDDMTPEEWADEEMNCWG